MRNLFHHIAQRLTRAVQERLQARAVRRQRDIDNAYTSGFIQGAQQGIQQGMQLGYQLGVLDAASQHINPDNTHCEDSQKPQLPYTPRWQQYEDEDNFE